MPAVKVNADLHMPTVQEELDRKTFETLEWLFGAVRRGNLTQDQFSTGVDTLFMAVSGLLGKDFIDLITAAQAECSNEAPVLKRVFVNGKKILVIKWTVGSTRVTVGKRVNGLATGGVATRFGFDAVLFSTVGLSQAFLADQLQVRDGLVEGSEDGIDGLLAKRFQHFLLL